jgi:hypothetical protein
MIWKVLNVEEDACVIRDLKIKIGQNVRIQGSVFVDQNPHSALSMGVLLKLLFGTIVSN